jgi:hypothetical protein
MNSQPRLAVLIDADNAQASAIEGILAAIATLGEATLRRIYGDFTSPFIASWRKVLNKHTLKPIQQFAYTNGKNATDSTMIIDAMDLMYSGKFEGFCLVTSDSDFTSLALRLREAGLQVYGFGEQKTPEAFRNACHSFIFTEEFRKPLTLENHLLNSTLIGTIQSKLTQASVEASAMLIQPEVSTDFLVEALNRSGDPSGWSNLATFGSYLQKIQPDFDARLHGFKKLSDLVRTRSDLFEVEERANALYVRSQRNNNN